MLDKKWTLFFLCAMVLPYYRSSSSYSNLFCWGEPGVDHCFFWLNLKSFRKSILFWFLGDLAQSWYDPTTKKNEVQKKILD